MKKVWLVLPVSVLMGLVSCNEAISSSSSSNNDLTSSTTSTTAVLDENYYLKKLEEKTQYYSVSYSYTVKDTLNNIYKKGTKRKSVFISSEGTDTKIEHIFGTTATRTSLDENSETKNLVFNYYFTPSATYYLSDDNRYNLKEETHPDIVPYTLAFDFTKASNVSLKLEGFDALLSGTVLQADSSSFLEQEGVIISSDISFKAILSKDRGAFKGFETSFTQSGYQINYSYSFSSLMSVIILPSV